MNADDKRLASLLGEVPLFAGMSDRSLLGIARQMKTYTRTAGEEVISEGAAAALGAMYVVLEGTAVVETSGTEIARLGPGQHFGEMSLLDGEPRSASVRAETDLTLASLSVWNFRALLHEENEIVDRVIATLVARLREADHRVVE